MKQLWQQYAAYNLWANKLITERITMLPEDIIMKETKSSFPTLYKTVAHLMDVESVWWQRLQSQENVEWPDISFKGNFNELAKQLLVLSSSWYDWVSQSNEENFRNVVGYYNSKKEYFKQPVYQILLQLFNHQTYHRGQLVTMMRENDIEKIPATDFIVFSRKE